MLKLAKQTRHTICKLDSTVISQSQYSAPKPMSVSLVYDSGFLLQFEFGGAWFLSTLMGVNAYDNTPYNGAISDVHCIDFGQAWSVTGMRKVIEEALGLILSGKVRIP